MASNWLHIAPWGRAYRGEYRCPSRQPTLGRKCLNLNQKKCKFLDDEQYLEYLQGSTATDDMLKQAELHSKLSSYLFDLEEYDRAAIEVEKAVAFYEDYAHGHH